MDCMTDGGAIDGCQYGKFKNGRCIYWNEGDAPERFLQSIKIKTSDGCHPSFYTEIKVDAYFDIDDLDAIDTEEIAQKLKSAFGELIGFTPIVTFIFENEKVKF